MKKGKFFIIAMAVLAVISMGLTGCEFDDLDSDDGTLIIRNDCFALPDIIIKVTIRQGSSSGNEVFNEVVSIAKDQNRSYLLAPGTYAVNIETDLVYSYDRTVSISKGITATLIYDDNGLHQ